MMAKEAIESDLIRKSNEVQKFYEGSCIFITGGSGFLGNLLIQKLIRDCPNISKLYLLIRPKKGKTSDQRIEEMFENIVFDKMKMEQPNFKEKIELITGDLEQPDLGLNEEDKKLISQNVNIVLHLAATVRLIEQLKKAMIINIRATRDLIQLAKTIVNLKVFIYASTAYSHCYRKNIDECVYDVPISSDRLIRIAETLNVAELDILTPKLTEGWPNTYSFSKAVAESVIKEYGKNLPVAIFRPSMVISTHKEPIKSWINNNYGPVGAAMATTAGLVRVLDISRDSLTDFVPGDYVINSLIVVVQHIGSTFKENKKKDYEDNVNLETRQYGNNVRVFNYVTTNENPLTWGEFQDMCQKYTMKWPTIYLIWHNFLILTTNTYLLKFYTFFLQTTPAYIIDLFLFATGKKQRMVKIHKTIERFNSQCAYFGTREWNFKNDNTQMLWEKLNKLDQTIFPFSMKEVNWHQYFENFAVGLRLYVFKDPLETLPKAKEKAQKLKIAHYSLVALLCFIAAWVVLRVLQVLFVLIL